jgi:DNA-binding NarL/FixJ family response regulator
MDWTGGLIEPPRIPALPAKSRKPNRPPSLRVHSPHKAQKLRGLPEVATPWGLTPHQVLIVRHLADGLSNEQIGKALGLNIKTVEVHVANLYERMQAVETALINRVRAAVLWDRFTRKAA